MPETGEQLAVPPLLRFSGRAVAALSRAREEIDALNVYPVPDGDTGTNLFLTFEAAHRALESALAEGSGRPESPRAELGADDDASPPLAVLAAAYARGLLLGARGNSGVITAQLVGALLRRIGTAAPQERWAAVVAAGFSAASRAGYAAVGDPVEGTILTVARKAAEAAEAAVQDPRVRTADVLAVATRAAREALDHTPEQLAVLRDAGVVDAGGAGLCVLLEAAEFAVTGRRELAGIRRSPSVPRAAARPLPRTARRDPGPGTEASAGHPAPTGDLTEGGPAYEVMYLLDTDEQGADSLRVALRPLGDSLVVVGGEELWNVHVHVDDVGAAIEAGLAVGRPHRIRVTHFADQLRAAHSRAHCDAGGTVPARRSGRAVVVVAFGAGLAGLFAEAGARPVTGTVSHRPSTGEVLEAVLATGAAEVVVLPNDADVMPAAEAAAGLAESDHGVRVAVVPSTAQVQGLAALAVHEPARPLEADLVEMTAAALHARSGAVTVAGRRAMTSAGQCEPGDVLGVVEGDFAVIGQDLELVALEVVERLLGGGGELVTVLAGEGGRAVAERCAEQVRAAHPTVEVLLHETGHERYPVLFGVE